MSKYTIEVCSTDPTPGEGRRLALILKRLLRPHGFRCTDYRAVPEALPPTIDPENAGKRASVAATRKEGAE